MCKRLELNIQLFAATATIINSRQGNYNIENNNETQRITFTVKRTSGTTYWQDNKTLTFTLKYYNNDGTQTTLTQSVQFNFPSGNVGATKSAYVDFTVPHKTDGTQSITFEASIATGTSVGTLHPTGSATLETIPRASSVTVNDANIGSATNIVINKASSGFTTTLWYKATGQNDWTKIVDKTANQVYGWTVPTSFYALIPSSKTIQCQIKADTYSGSDLIGSSITTGTFTATGSPIINSITAVDTNSTTVALTGNSANMIRYVSNVRINISYSAQNSASIASCKINGLESANGERTFNNCNTNSFEVIVTDTRGYSTTSTKTMTMVNYVPLTLNTTVTRNQPTDNKVNISCSGNYYNGSFGSQSNTLTIRYRYKESTASWGNTWQTINPTTSGSTYSASTQISNIDYTKQYDFQVEAADRCMTIPVSGLVVTQGQPVFNWARDLFNINGSITLYENDKAPWHLYQKTIDLSSYNQSTYYPVVAVTQIPRRGLHRIVESVSLDSGTVPTWSTHGSGFTSLIDILQTYPGWGTTNGTNIIIDEQYRFTDSVKPAWYHILTETSIPCFYLRGGGKYFLYTDWKTEWTIHTSSYTYSSTDTVAPTTTAGNSDGNIIAFKSEIPTNNNQLTNGRGFVTLSEVVSEGSNSNGSFIKLESGTMICRKKVTGTANITTTWGNGYTTGSSNTIDLGDFAQGFIEEPILQITPHRGSESYNFFLGTVDQTTSSYAGKVSLLRFTSQSSVGYALDVVAIGKWK